MSIRFIYLYRDGSNYKAWGDVIFSQLACWSEAEITSRISNCLDEFNTFVAHQVRMPEVFLWREQPPTADDHCFHEFHSVEMTNEEPNDFHRRDIERFVAEMEGATRRGWQVFDILRP